MAAKRKNNSHGKRPRHKMLNMGIQAGKGAYQAYKIAKKVFAATKSRRPPSPARSRTRSKIGHDKKMDDNFSGTKSFTKHTFHHSKLYKGWKLARATGYHLFKNGDVLVSGTPGTQAVSTIFNIGDKGFFTDVVLPLVQTAESKSTGAALVDYGAKRFMLNHLSARFNMVNSSVGATELIIYDLICKRDCLNTVIEDINRGLIAAEQLLDVTIRDASVYGQAMEQSADFRMNWRVIKRTTVNMSPGALHEHKIMLDYDKIFNTGLLQGDNGLNLNGFTYNCLVVARGQPVYDETIEGVTSAPIRIPITYWYNMKYNMIYGANSGLSTSVTLEQPANPVTDKFDFVSRFGTVVQEIANVVPDL